MLCSNCSQRVRPIVACDIDGVLGNYHAHIHKFAAGYFGDEDLEGFLNQYDGSISHGDWFEVTGITKADFRSMKLAYRQGAMKRTMPPFSGAILAMRMIKSYGVELWLTTTRPYLRLDNIDPDTQFWLKLQAIPYDFMLYDENKYDVLGGRVDKPRVVAIVDDYDEMYDAAESVFGEGVPILYKTGYNSAVERTNMARDGRELHAGVLERVQVFERNYG